MNNIVKGPEVPMPSEQFGAYLFNKISSQIPSRIAAIDVETTEEITIRDLQENIIKTAKALNKHVAQNDNFACVCENEFVSIFPIIASMYLGTTISLVNPTYNLRELLHNFNQSTPKVVFCSKNALQNVIEAKRQASYIELVIVLSRDVKEGVISIFDFIKNEDVFKFQPQIIDENQTAVLLSSSGTSGPPKGVMLSYKNLRGCVPSMTEKKYVALSSDSNTLVLVPIFHIFGLFLALFSICGSMTAIFMKKFIPCVFIQSIQEYNITQLAIVPPLAIFLAKHPIVDNYDLSCLKDIFCGAAPLAQNIIDLIKKRLNITVRQVYGLSEACITSAMPLNETRANSCGKVCPNLECVIRDEETGQYLPRNKNGEICVKGPTIMNGYINNPNATMQSFEEHGFLVTGDVGYIDDDGFLYIKDRIKDIIKCKGFQVAPSELEDVILAHPGIKEAAVIGVPDERAGEVPFAFVVKDAASGVTEEQLVDFVAHKVSITKRLTGGVRFVNGIPKNGSGKILKRTLKLQLQE